MVKALKLLVIALCTVLYISFSAVAFMAVIEEYGESNSGENNNSPSLDSGNKDDTPPADDGEDTPDAPPADDGEDTPDAPPADDGEDTPDAPPADDGEDIPDAPPADDGEDIPDAPPAPEPDEPTPEPPAPNIIVGVFWDRSESTALGRLTTENDSIVNTNIANEPRAGVGDELGFSPFDSYYPWSAMKEYNVIDNEIAYSSDDEGFSRTAYDTVVYIPKFYYKVVDDGESRKFYISAEKIEGFELHPGSGNYVAKYNTSDGYLTVSGEAPLTSVTRGEVRTNARAKGDNWSQYDFATWNAIQMLYLVEYADWNVQKTIGRGIVDTTELGYATGVQSTGGCDTMAYHTGRAAGIDGYTQVQYRYIEGLWGNCCEWVDGINMSDRATYISLDYRNYADDTAEGYIATGHSLPKTGKIQNVGHSEVFPWAFLPSESSADADYTNPTYVPDKVCSGDGWRILYTSNNFEGINLAGLFRFSTSSLSTRVHSTYGSRLVFHGDSDTDN